MHVIYSLNHMTEESWVMLLCNAPWRVDVKLYAFLVQVSGYLHSSSALYLVLPLGRRLYGPKSPSGRGSEEKSLPQPGIELRSSKPYPVTYISEGNLSGKSVSVTEDLI
jgi:hypothetical protein